MSLRAGCAAVGTDSRAAAGGFQGKGTAKHRECGVLERLQTVSAIQTSASEAEVIMFLICVSQNTKISPDFLRKCLN